jgi:hypothetical protein
MSGHVLEVPALSRASIRQTAELVRRLAQEHLGVENEPYFPVMDVLEPLLLVLDPEFELQVVERSKMGEEHGLTIPGQHLIRLREDVYDRACEGKGRDRGTAAHEMGHYILHHDLALPRRMREEDLMPYRSSEWQAKAFAGELLVSAQFVKNGEGATAVARRFGVSDQAAEHQLRVLIREGKIRPAIVL